MAVGAVVMPDAPDVDFASNEPVSFHASDRGATLTTNHPLFKAAILELAESRPRMLPFEVLLARIQERLRPRLAEPFPDEVAREYLCDALRRAFSVDLVALSVRPPRFAADPGARPTASPLARLQAAQGRRITNIAGRGVEPDALDRLVLGLLDGGRDRAGLAEALKGRIVSGEFVVSFDGRTLVDPTELDAAVPNLVEESLGRLASMSLLIA
jgi:hypothetical protein